MSMNLRNISFWLLDRFKGSPTKEHYDDIKDIMENYDSGLVKSQEYLSRILKHACEKTEYYKKNDYKKDIRSFPVITKAILKENYNQFISNDFDEKKLIKVNTSGSYGTPFTFLLSEEKKTRQRAEIIYFGEWAEYIIGMKHAYLRANDNKSKMKLFIQNEIFIKTGSLSQRWLEKQRKLIKSTKVKNLIGFPSVISTIAQYCIDKGDDAIDFNVRGVIISGESLYDNQRDTIEKAFGAECLSRYSTEELGVLAHECKKEHKHHINISSYHIEVLKLEEDVTAEPGELGRIVVTDLFSYAFPLIRYETGDLGIMSEECSCGMKTPILESVEGRNLETILTTDGGKISPFFVNPIMKDYKKIIQFQFVQIDKINYTLKIVGELNKNEVDKLKEKYINILGGKAILTIEMVEDIPTLKSGKRAYVVNEYTKK